MQQEQYKHEVVHRWVHKMQDQKGHTLRRYGLAHNAIWTPRRRKPVARPKG